MCCCILKSNGHVLLGTIVSKLRGLDLPTFDALEAAVKAAVQLHESKVKDVQHIIGCTDYETMFKSLKPKISGIQLVKEFRISLDEDGSVQVLYKADSTRDGWFPKPLEQDIGMDVWQNLFKHDDPEQGLLANIKDPFPCLAKGLRNCWNYPLHYAGGCDLTIQLKCISLPYIFPEIAVVKTMVAAGRRQVLDGDLSTPEQRQKVLTKIKELLISRSCLKDISNWETIFNRIEVAVGSDCTGHVSVLERLMNSYGGEVRPVEPRRAMPYMYDEDLVQPITFRGGPIRNDEDRQKIIAARATRLNLNYMKLNKTLFPNRYVSNRLLRYSIFLL